MGGEATGKAGRYEAPESSASVRARLEPWGVGGGDVTQPGLTWVGGGRAAEDLDETSRKILAATSSGTSIFDPVLCELAYRWFSPPSGTVLDPFAGGSVRGIVAASLGRSYVGIDLRPEQVAANEEQGAIILGTNAERARWIAGDSAALDDLLSPGFAADFVFSCPPYGDLEVYSDDERDLSRKTPGDFLAAYRVIIAKACARLKPDAFACFVIGDYRDKRGSYCNFVGETIAAFLAAGLTLYNEAVLVTMVGSLSIRVGAQFVRGRKLGKTHQNVLVFLKGDSKRATAAIGPVECGDVPGEGGA